MPGGNYCILTCTEDVDCCNGDAMCEQQLGSYPYSWSCNAGLCAFAGCSTDDECTFGGILPTWICLDFGDFSACEPGCSSDADCSDQFLDGWVCTGDGGYCEPPTCMSDDDCTQGLACNLATGICGGGCTSDADCGDFGYCELETGACVCMADDDCGPGYACAAL